MDYISVSATLPFIVFLVWFWAIHSGTGIFKFAKVSAWLSTGETEHDGSEASIIQYDWRDSFLRAVVVWGIYLTLSSEILSLARLLSRSGILLGWSIALVLTLFLAGRTGLVDGVKVLREKIRFLFKSNPQFHLSEVTVFISILFAYISVTFLIALVAPPNTNDSLQYHMPRVMHWLQNRSLEHYATPIERQIWMPIWAETAILHFFALAGSDYLSNLVQWFSMIISLIGVSLIAAWLGAKPRGQLLAMLFAVSIPMGVLQSTSTQNDYVNACWGICLAYFILRMLRSKQYSLIDLLWAAGSAGLGLLTKGTFVTFALPFLTVLAIFLWRKKDKKIFITSLLAGIIVIWLVNSGIWIRNFKTYQNPLGPDRGIRYLANEIYGIRPFVSNLIRNITINLSTQFNLKINGLIYDGVAWFHEAIGQDINDPRTSLDEYWVKQQLHEDFAGNPLHFVSILITFFIVLSPSVLKWWRLVDQHYQPILQSVLFNRREILTYAGCVFASFLIFSILYKWQRTGTRLQLPFFVLWSPIFGLSMEIFGKSRLVKITTGAITLLIALSSVKALVANPSRQLFSMQSMTSPLFDNTRQDLLFMNNPEIKPAFLVMIETAREQQCKSIGLSIDSSDAEYPFWALLSPTGKETHIEHLFSTEELSRYIHKDPNMCAIICSVCKADIVENLTLVESSGNFDYYLIDWNKKP